MGIPTTVPQFPTPEGECVRGLAESVAPASRKINKNSLLTGHSRGGMFLLKVLERLDIVIDTAVFVAAPVGVRPISFYDDDKKFSNFEFDWEKIRKSAKNFIVYHSGNDPYVSLGNVQELAKKLGIELTFLPNMRHINADSEVFEFPKLLQDLKFKEKK